jgi:hypothetical protein
METPIIARERTTHSSSVISSGRMTRIPNPNRRINATYHSPSCIQCLNIFSAALRASLWLCEALWPVVFIVCGNNKSIKLLIREPWEIPAAYSSTVYALNNSAKRTRLPILFSISSCLFDATSCVLVSRLGKNTGIDTYRYLSYNICPWVAENPVYRKRLMRSQGSQIFRHDVLFKLITKKIYIWS